MFKLDLEKAEEPEIKLPTSVGSSKKQESLTVWITTNSGKFLKGWEYQTTQLASWEIYMQVKKQQLELDIKQLVPLESVGNWLVKEYVRAVYCHSAYLTYMQSTSWETLG